MANWGDTTANATPVFILDANLMGGTSPDLDDMVLKSISMDIGATGWVRLAVYQGGTLDGTGPEGASLIWDAGKVDPSGVGFRTIGGGGAALAKNAVTWVAFKADDISVGTAYDTTGDAGNDFQTARGRWRSTGENADEDVAWSATLPTGGSFANFWYALYLTYEIKGDSNLYLRSDMEVGEGPSQPSDPENVRLRDYTSKLDDAAGVDKMFWLGK